MTDHLPAGIHEGKKLGIEQTIRFSHLRAYGKSPLHGHTALTGVEQDVTNSMQLGTAVHALYAKHKLVCGYPGKVRRGKEFDAFAADHPGHEILTMSAYENALAMADAVRNCELAQPYLEGVREETLLFRWNGLNCRATPDIRGNNFLTELKTSATSEPNRFLWHALKMHYHAQMRMQMLACPAAKDCFIVCVEAKVPYPVTVFHIEPRALEQGEKCLTLWAEALKGYEASGVFPPYVSCVMPLDIPEDEEFQLEFGEEE